MSDINHNRMIPLHIADQAVANCEAEIQRLREENARLKAEVERLRKAGDAMANWFRPVAGVESLPAHIVYESWKAAKEGKQP